MTSGVPAVIDRDNWLERFESARFELENVHTVVEARDFAAMAVSLERATKAFKLGDEAEAHARGLRLWAQRRMGELLAEEPKATGGQPYQATGTNAVPVETPTLADLGITKNESKRAQDLAKIPEEEFEQKVAHVARASGNNEWFTPAEYTDAARDVMGAIDVDPASSAEANATVGAAHYFTEADDGLAQEWRGRVWMNPPYAQPLIAQFCQKLTESFSAGDVTEAVVLVNNATETAHFQRLLKSASAICLPAGRIRFWYPGRESITPLQGQVIFYFGAQPDVFRARFSDFGFTAAF